ncbi:MAG: hypothetical protein QGF68_06785 [Nitrospinota bacterium]|jgi:hypothetical protein|nr:hypothetical protein [Nitrospinota bacterium]
MIDESNENPLKPNDETPIGESKKGSNQENAKDTKAESDKGYETVNGEAVERSPEDLRENTEVDLSTGGNRLSARGIGNLPEALVFKWTLIVAGIAAVISAIAGGVNYCTAIQ